jgi:hypothetical protein
MASEIRVNSITNRSGLGTVTFSDTGVVLSGVSTFTVSAGSATSPSITPTGDSNTGIFFPSPDTIAFAEGGVEALRINSSRYIGIGTDNPQKVIDISGSITGLTTAGRLQLHPHSAGFDIVSTAGNISPHYQTNISLYTGQLGSGTLRWQIDGSGRVTKPYQPVFKAYRSASTSGAGVIAFNNVIYNVGSSYNNSNGLFTAPVAGYYIFFFLSIGSGVSNTYRDVWGSVNGTTTPSSFGARPTNQTTDFSSAAAASNIVYLNANDTFGIYASGSLYSDSNIWLQFGGYLLG